MDGNFFGSIDPKLNYVAFHSEHRHRNAPVNGARIVQRLAVE
jgi:hypothetical protein